jgi:preprotein translocase subunit SecE
MAKKKDRAQGGEAKTARTKDKTQKARGSKAAQRASDDPYRGPVGRVRQFREFIEQAKIELKKVTWPSRRETMTTSVAVLVLVFVMSVYLGVVDIALSKLVEFILSG